MLEDVNLIFHEGPGGGGVDISSEDVPRGTCRHECCGESNSHPLWVHEGIAAALHPVPLLTVGPGPALGEGCADTGSWGHWNKGPF